MKRLLNLIIVVSIVSFQCGDRCNEHSLVQNVEQSDSPDTNPEARLNYMNTRRDGGYDFKQLQTAKKYVKKQMENISSSLRDGGINGWTSLGPKNIGGRVRGLAIHPTQPSIMFAGAASGGIWKSTNAGASWYLSNSTYHAYPVMDIIFHPNDPSIIFAVTGEYRGTKYPGVGVLRSQDTGNTWEVMNQPPTDDFTFLSKIRYHPTQLNTMYVAGSKRTPSGSNNVGVVYRSINGGMDWTEFWTDSLSNNVYDLEIVPDNPWIMMLGTNCKAYESTNGSAIFDEVSMIDEDEGNENHSRGRYEVASCKSDPDIRYLMRYLYYESDTATNNYKTELWKSSGEDYIIEASTSGSQSNNILGKQGFYDNTLWVNPINCDQVFMGGVETHKYNGTGNPEQISDADHDIDSNSWQSTNSSIHADQHVMIEHPDFDNVNNTTLYIGNDGGVYYTDDVNEVSLYEHWFALNDDMEITQFYGGDISHDGVIVVGGSQDNHYIYDLNNNNGLKIWNHYSRGDGGFCKIDKNTTNTFYTTTQKGSLYKTTDNGTSFCHILSFFSSSPKDCCDCNSSFYYNEEESSFIPPFEISRSDSDKLYLAGTNLFFSDDAGASWDSITNFTNVTNNEITALNVYFTNPDVIWFGRKSSSVWKTTQGGGDWQTDWEAFDENTTGILPNKIVTDIAINPLNADKVAVTFGGYHQSHIFITEDGGNTWNARSLGFPIQVNTVTWLPSRTNVLYVGTDIGVFASEDVGLSWSVMPYLDNNEGPVYTGIEELFWQGNGTTAFPHKLVAASYGRGMWRTNTSINGQLFVDKNCSPCGEGTVMRPFKYFHEAVEQALHDSEIVFLSSGKHDVVPTEILLDKKIQITPTNGSITID